MEEIKKGTEVLVQIEQGVLPLPLIVAYELSYLQLRYICELIAISCLAAHAEIGKNSDLYRAYNADKIIKRMALLHPNFYPVPTVQVLDPITKRPAETKFYQGDYLTRDKLLKVYAECGDVLHRGSLRRVSTRNDKDLDFKKISRWKHLIVALLNHHQIQLLDEDRMFWVLMQAEDGRVHGSLMLKQAS
jgi:hypothetical protein